LNFMKHFARNFMWELFLYFFEKHPMCLFSCRVSSARPSLSRHVFQRLLDFGRNTRRQAKYSCCHLSHR
jgi:hypothetical protein